MLCKIVVYETIDGHGLKIQGVAQISAKIPGFQDKIARGSLILGFISFLLANFWDICMGVPFHPPFSPPTHLCASLYETNLSIKSVFPSQALLCFMTYLTSLH
jgi:hypothetical protein